jgi:hypothetical protein
MSFRLNLVFTFKPPILVENVTSLSSGLRASISFEKPNKMLPAPELGCC